MCDSTLFVSYHPGLFQYMFYYIFYYYSCRAYICINLKKYILIFSAGLSGLGLQNGLPSLSSSPAQRDTPGKHSMDYSRYVRRYGSSLECGNASCRELNHRYVLGVMIRSNVQVRVIARVSNTLRNWFHENQLFSFNTPISKFLFQSNLR